MGVHLKISKSVLEGLVAKYSKWICYISKSCLIKFVTLKISELIIDKLIFNGWIFDQMLSYLSLTFEWNWIWIHYESDAEEQCQSWHRPEDMRFVETIEQKPFWTELTVWNSAESLSFLQNTNQLRNGKGGSKRWWYYLILLVFLGWVAN